MIVGIIIISSMVSASFGLDNTNIPSLRDAVTTTVSGNLTNFTSLEDTPSSYSGDGDKCVTVKNDETGLEFITCPSGGITNISEAGDVDYSGVDDNDVLRWDQSLLQWVDSKMNSILSFGDNYLFFSGNNEITFNETKLNVTIDARASGGNTSWNQTFADTLYAPNTTEGIQYLINWTGIYSTYNATYANHIQDNQSWNETKANTIYILQSEESNLNVNYSVTSNSTTGWAGLTGWVSDWFFNDGNELNFNETKLNETLDPRYIKKSGDQFYPGADLNFSDGGINEVNYIQANLTYNGTCEEGKLMWNEEEGTYQYGLPGGDVCLQVGQEGLKRVWNDYGSTISNGKLVYSTGVHAGRPTIGLADNADPDKIHILGMATEDIPNNSFGYVALWGTVRGLNTNSHPPSTKLYLTTEGNWTDTHPSDSTHAVIVIGEVVTQHATEGEIELGLVYFTLGNNYDGTLLQSIINKNQGPSAATGFTSVNDAGKRFTIGIGGSNNTVFPNISVLYSAGWGDLWQAVDGAKDFVWFTDPTDSHNNTALDYERMRLDYRGNLNVSGNITTEEYYFGQPLEGSLDSGIIWADEISDSGTLNLTHLSGLDISYSNFTVRLVSTTTGNEVYCDIPNNTITVPDNAHTAYFVDTSCSVQNVPISTFVDAAINRDGNTPIFHVQTQSGIMRMHQGLPIQNRIYIRSRILAFRTIHLDTVSGLGLTEEGDLNFTINSGEYVFVDEVVSSTEQNISNGSGLTIFYRNGGNYYYDNATTGLNLTSCEDASQNLVDCSSPLKYRRHFIFLAGYTNNDDDTSLGQRLASDDETYNNIGDCLNTEASPLTYDLPDIFKYTAVPLFVYCGQGTDTIFDGSFIDLRTVQTGSAGSDIDTSIFLTTDGSRPLTNNWDVGSYNITTTGWFKGLFNWVVDSIYANFNGTTLVINDTKLNENFNQTQLILDSNDTWSSTYNATYNGHVQNNNSWNQTYADSLYAPNTTEGIQYLVNNTGIYSTYNESYDLKLGSPWQSNSTIIYNETANVGIGVNNPVTKLDIYSQTNQTTFGLYSAGQQIIHYYNPTKDSLGIPSTLNVYTILNSSFDIIGNYSNGTVGHDIGILHTMVPNGNLTSEVDIGIESRLDPTVLGNGHNYTLKRPYMFLATITGNGGQIEEWGGYVIPDMGPAKGTADFFYGFYNKDPGIIGIKNLGTTELEGNVTVGNDTDYMFVNNDGNLFFRGASSIQISPNASIWEFELNDTFRHVFNLTTESYDYTDSTGDASIKLYPMIGQVNATDFCIETGTCLSGVVNNNGSWNESLADDLYLKLDASNDPLTGELALQNNLQLLLLATGEIDDGTGIKRSTANLTMFPFAGNNFVFQAMGNHDVEFWNSAGQDTYHFENLVGTTVFNEQGSNIDFRFEGTSDNLLYLDAGNNRVGIGTDSPATNLDVEAVNNAEVRLTTSSGAVGDNGTLTLLSYTNDIPYAQIKGTWSAGGDGDITFHTTTDAGVSILERMRITDDGKVGIGTDSPAEELQIEAYSPTILINSTSTSGGDSQLKFGNAVGGTRGSRIYHDTSANDLIIETNRNNDAGDIVFNTKAEATPIEVMRLKGSGFVGIGTPSPGEKLEVVGNILLNASSAQIKSIDQAGNEDNIINYNAQDDLLLGWGMASTDYVAIAPGQSISFRVDGDGDINLNNTMYVDKGGKVGIGTDSPTAVLHVKAPGAINEVLHLESSAGPAIIFNDTTEGAFWTINTGSTGPDLFFNYNSVTGGSKMTILQDGNVGIGTTSPGALLEIESATSSTLLMDGGGGYFDVGMNVELDMHYYRAAGSPNWDFRAFPQDGTSGANFRFGLASGSTGTNNILLYDSDSSTVKHLIGTSSVSFNENGEDNDFKIESLNDPNIFTVNGGTDRIGIGTGSPLSKLNVHGNNISLTISDSRTGVWVANESIMGLDFYSYDTSVGGPGMMGQIEIIESQGGSAPRPAMVFRTTDRANESYPMIENMRIDGITGDITMATVEGSVGIGTTSTTATLDVEGNIRMKGSNAGNIYNPRDGSGAEWQQYNPTGDNLMLYNGATNVVEFSTGGDILLDRSLLLDGQGRTSSVGISMGALHIWLLDGAKTFYGDAFDGAIGWDNTNEWLQITGTTAGGKNIFSAYSNTLSSSFTTTPVKIPFDVEERDDSFYSHSTTTGVNGNVTVLKSGDYMVEFDASVDVWSGSARSTARCYIEVNDVEDDGSRCFTYNRLAGNGDSSCHTRKIITLVANDKVSVECVRHTGTDTLIVTPDGSRINLEWVE